jgi:hypothetical protein
MNNAGNDIVLPPEFSGPAQLLLYTRYGDPRDTGFENKWINPWHVQALFPWFPVEWLQIHKHFWPLLEAAFKDLEIYGIADVIKSCGACYKIRTTKEDPLLLSLHSWGAAIDLNTQANIAGVQDRWSQGFIEVMQAHKIYCRQLSEGPRAHSHFAMVNG